MATDHPTKNCLQCNKPFTPRLHDPRRAKFCSAECRRAVRLANSAARKTGGKEPCTCLHCGKEFDYYPSQGVRKYCSRECKHEHWKQPSAERGFEDLTGQVFDRLTVIEYAGLAPGPHHTWRCRCSCPEANERVVMGQSLKSGRTRSCGCIAKGVGVPKPDTKVCTKCGHEYPYTEEFFYKRPKFRWGLSPWCLTCIMPIIRKRHERYRRRLKREVLAHYSGGGEPQCVCCGIGGSLHFLTLDHINNDGKEDRKIHGLGAVFYARMKKLGYPNHLQVLCWNCNLGRRDNGGVCPHKEQKES